MKDRILNICMLIAVAAAVIAALFSQSAAPEKELLPLNLTAPTAAPTIHPAEAYRAHRRETREQETEALCVSRGGEAVVFVEGPIQERDAALVMAIVESAADIPRENIRVTDYAF